MSPRMLSGLLLALGCSDASLKAVNAPPDAAITSHVDREAVTADVALELRGQASDADDAADGLTAAWFVDGVETCTGAPADGGRTVCTVTLGAGEAAVSLEVTDPAGSVATDRLTLVAVVSDTGGEAPTCGITAPDGDVALTEGEVLRVDAWVADADTSLDQLAVTWTSDKDGDLGTSSPASDGAVVFTTDALSVDAHTVSMHVDDGDGGTCSALVVVTVASGVDLPPSAPSVVITPDPATSADDLVAVATGSVDPEGEAVTLSYTWFVDGVEQADWTTDTVAAAATSRDEVWLVVVTPQDGTQAGPPGEAQVTIGDSLPVVSSVSLSPDPATTDDTLIAAVTATDGDGDPITLAYAWTVDGVGVTATGDSLDGGTHFDKHQDVVVTVTPSDHSGTGLPVSSAVLTIANSPPEAPGVSISPASPRAGGALRCLVDTDGVDADGDTLTYEMTWDVDGVAYVAGGDSGDTGGPWVGPSTTTWADDTVPAAETEAGEVWTCTVTPDDGDDLGTAAAVSVTILEAPTIPSDCPDSDCALRFDGVNDYVEVPHDASLNTGGGAFTVEAWIYYDVIYGNCMTAVRKGTATSPTYEYWLHKNWAPEDSLHWGSWTGFTVTSWSAVSAGAWVHYAGVHDPGAGEARTYVNGVYQASQTPHGAPTGNTDPMRIGIDWDFGCAMDGVLDEIRISSVVRYASDFTPATAFTADADTMALYHFDEYTGSIAYDSSGNGNDGVIYGATWTTESP